MTLIPESYSCVNCGHVNDSAVAQCPNCGERMLSAGSYRRRGWLMIIVGVGLAVFMTVVITNVALTIYHQDEPGAKARFTGGTGMIVFMFSVLGLVLSMGLAFIVNGVWQILYGKSNPNLLAIVLGLWSVLMTLAWLVQWIR